MRKELLSILIHLYQFKGAGRIEVLQCKIDWISVDAAIAIGRSDLIDI
jgi:hypothetical protein